MIGDNMIRYEAKEENLKKQVVIVKELMKAMSEDENMCFELAMAIRWEILRHIVAKIPDVMKEMDKKVDKFSCKPRKTEGVPKVNDE